MHKFLRLESFSWNRVRLEKLILEEKYSFIYSKNLCLRGRNRMLSLPSLTSINTSEGIYKWSSSQRWPAENWHRTSYTRVRKIPTQPGKMKQKRETERRPALTWESWRNERFPLGEAPSQCGDRLGQRGTFGELEEAHSSWSVEVRQSRTYVNGPCAPCVPQLELCLLLRRGVDCCKWSLEQFVQHMVKVLWLDQTCQKWVTKFHAADLSLDDAHW